MAARISAWSGVRVDADIGLWCQERRRRATPTVAPGSQASFYSSRRHDLRAFIAQALAHHGEAVEVVDDAAEDAALVRVGVAVRRVDRGRKVDEGVAAIGERDLVDAGIPDDVAGRQPAPVLELQAQISARQALVLGYGAVPEQQMTAAVRRLASALREVRQLQSG
jgi:hypothetical protein